MIRSISLLSGEYVAGFVPLGHYLATGEIAAAAATTGTATKLLLCGLSDAKLHRILPAVYLLAATPSRMALQSPLQDTTTSGSNPVDQVAAELPKGLCIGWHRKLERAAFGRTSPTQAIKACGAYHATGRIVGRDLRRVCLLDTDTAILVVGSYTNEEAHAQKL